VYRPYVLRPVDLGYSYALTSLHTPKGGLIWPTKNMGIDRHSLKTRPGYAEDRDLGAGVEVLGIKIYQLKDGTRNTMYVTDGDLCQKETGGSNTFSYKTESYTTGTVTNITGAVVTGSGTAWSANLAAGDKFITTTDHSSQIEPDTNWGTILTADSATQITLTAGYTGTTGAMSDTYVARKVYTNTSNERPFMAVVDDMLCFGNKNINVQKYTGTGYASDLDSTYATKARYGIEYANRLILADLEVSGTRDQSALQWSKEGDPENYTDSTSGITYLLETADYIAGLAKLGPDIVVYKENSIIIGSQTGIATDPLFFHTTRLGIGNWAPASIIEGYFTNAFLGINDFYKIDGDHPVSIGEQIRDFFFDVTTLDNAKNTVGFPVEEKSEFHWLATTTEGQLDFVYSNREKKWTVYDLNDAILCGGLGAI